METGWWCVGLQSRSDLDCLLWGEFQSGLDPLAPFADFLAKR